MTYYAHYRELLPPGSEPPRANHIANSRPVLGKEFFNGTSGTIEECNKWINEYVKSVTPESCQGSDLHASSTHSVVYAPKWVYDNGYEHWCIVNQTE